MQKLEKCFLSAVELAAYLGVSLSYVYKLSFNNTLPKYCPGGKLIYFLKQDVDDWLRKCRVASKEEIDAEAELETYKSRRGAK